MHFLEDETQYFVENEKKESQKRSFVAMKIITLHSYFHFNMNGFKFKGNEKDFFEPYQSFIDSMKPFFDSDQDLLDYYISFSKISLLSICFMGNFQYRIFLLKKLMSLKFNKLSFLKLHPSHPEIIYHVFLIMISSVISHRAPQHFFIEEDLQENEEEEEEANEEDNTNDNKKFIEEVTNFIDANDSSKTPDLVKYIVSQISFFTSEIPNFDKFNADIIMRSITDNGILSVTNDVKDMLSKILKKSIDFSTINANYIERPFSQNLLEIINEVKSFDQIVVKINKIIDNNETLFKDKNLFYVANPQFAIVDTLMLKLGKLERSTKCKYKEKKLDDNDYGMCSKHQEFIGVDWNDLIPKLTPSNRCPYCVINDEPSNLQLTTSYNNTVRMTYDFDKLNDDFKSDFRSIMYLNIYNAIEEDDLHPIELHLLRMIMIVSESRFKSKNKDKDQEHKIDLKTKNQLAICIASIASLLFPYTSFNLSSTATVYFIQDVLDKISLLMLSHYNINKNNSGKKQTYREVRKIFASAISPFMRGIFERLRKTLLSNSEYKDGLFKEKIQLAFMTPEDNKAEDTKTESDSNKKKKKSKPKEELIIDENYRLNSPLKPMGSKFFLRQFLLEPNLRRKCPVIYSYLRLNDRFDRTRFIGKLVPSLKQILRYAYHPHPENVINNSIKTINEVEEDFLENWRLAASDIEKDLLTEEARKCLNETLVDEPTIASFLPRKHENWPVMMVMLSLSDAQNKFIKTLSKYVNIVIKDIDDFDITTSRDNYRIRSSLLNVPLMNSIKGHFIVDELGFRCQFEEKQEKQFRNQLSESTYYYIIHKSLSMRATFTYNGEGIVAQYRHIFKSRPMSNQQLIYMNKLKKNGKGTGLSLLLENLMFRLIGTASAESSAGGSKSIDEEIQEMMRKDKNDNGYQLTSIENDAFYDFLNAKNYMSDKLTLDQIPSIYEYLNSLQDDAAILELSIGAQLSDSFKNVTPYQYESIICSKLDKIAMSKIEYSDLSNVMVLMMASVNEKSTSQKNFQAMGIYELFNEIKEAFQLTRTQNHTMSKVKSVLNDLNTNYLPIIYEYCMRKSI